MRRTLLILALLPAFVGAIQAQSGRRAPDPKPTPVPVPTPPEPESLQLKKDDKPKPPEVVDGERIYIAREVDERARIRNRPAPGYTREARKHLTRGTVVVRCILSADETVKHIEVLTGLPDGLSEKAIEAARRIKFTPARKDGKPVSVWILLEYRFNIY